jgi:hypothetical protein
MKNILSVLFLAISMYCLAQKKTVEPAIVQPGQMVKPSLNDSLMGRISIQQNELRTNIDSIKTTLTIVKKNTEPPNVFSQFLQGKVLDEIYHWMFSKEQSGGLITFLISCFGLLASFIKFITAVVDADKWIFKKDPDKKWAIPKAALYLFYFVVSGLLFVAANRSYDTHGSANIKNLEIRIERLTSEIHKIGIPSTIKTRSDTTVSTVDFSPKLDSLSVQLTSVQNMIVESENRTAEFVKERSTSSITIFFGFVLLLVIAAPLIEKYFR